MPIHISEAYLRVREDLEDKSQDGKKTRHTKLESDGMKWARMVKEADGNHNLVLMKVIVLQASKYFAVILVKLFPENIWYTKTPTHLVLWLNYLLVPKLMESGIHLGHTDPRIWMVVINRYIQSHKQLYNILLCIQACWYYGSKTCIYHIYYNTSISTFYNGFFVSVWQRTLWHSKSLVQKVDTVNPIWAFRKSEGHCKKREAWCLR